MKIIQTIMKKYILLVAVCLLNAPSFSQKNRKNTPAPLPPPEVIRATNATDRMAGFAQRKALDGVSLVNNIKFRSVEIGRAHV